MFAKIKKFSLRLFVAILIFIIAVLAILLSYPRLRPHTGQPIPIDQLRVGALALRGVQIIHPNKLASAAPANQRLGEQPSVSANSLQQTVLVRDGKFVAILPSDAPIPPEYAIIQAQGKFLLPGLIDLHVHVFDESELALMLAQGVTSARNMMGLPLHLRMREALTKGELHGPRFFQR